MRLAWAERRSAADAEVFGECQRGSRLPAVRSIPPAAHEPAKGDETDERDDYSEHKAPKKRHHDSNDHEDAADRDSADFAISHADCPPS